MEEKSRDSGMLFFPDRRFKGVDVKSRMLPHPHLEMFQRNHDVQLATLIMVYGNYVDLFA
jgi:hypothetical protein